MDLFKTSVVAVIGTAGRKDDAARLKVDSFDRMYDFACGTIAEWGVREAVSGGAAWADHVAVRLFLDGKVERLRLHFPAVFAGGRFQMNQDGEIANHYHRKFTAARGFDSLAEIAEAVAKGADVTVSRGFFARNAIVAREATHMLAFTFGQPSQDAPDGVPYADFLPSDAGFKQSEAGGLRDGGTAHTWQRCRGAEVKRHVDLRLLLADEARPAMAL